MGIRDQHPEFIDRLQEWQQMEDTYAGERKVKVKEFIYLPPTAGQQVDGLNTNQKGRKNYNSYRLRARFPDFVSQAVQALIGIMHNKPAKIKVPAIMEPLVEKGTVKNESLQMLLRRINHDQLVYGRIGLLADVRTGQQAGTLPYIATYKAKHIINWDDGKRDDPVLQKLNLVVLDETEPVRKADFSWVSQNRYRVLLLGRLTADDDEGAKYRVGVFKDDDKGSDNFNEEEMVTPTLGGRDLDELPFVFINGKDLVPDTDDPPMLGLSNLALSVYRSEADYRQHMHVIGQDTLVVSGHSGDGDIRAGAGAFIEVDINGDAKYIGITSKGLEEQRKALENDRKEAAEMGGHLIDNAGREAESGNALRIRVMARTATLNQIAIAGAEGLQTILRIIATWVNANPDEVEVTPNLDFTTSEVDGDTLVKWATAKSLGLPWSWESIHRKLRDKEMTIMEFDEEQALIDEEQPLGNEKLLDDNTDNQARKDEDT